MTPPNAAAASGPIVVVAGRRIDAPDSPVRFPLDRARVVAERISSFLAVHRATGLVASAACGTDLLALEEAAALGVPRRIVLPFERDRFRESSVVDRPGGWGPRFDRALDDAGTASLRVLDAGDGDAAYAAANDALLEEAAELARVTDATALAVPVVALIVWEGAPREGNDLTAEFADKARALRIPVAEILTTT